MGRRKLTEQEKMDRKQQRLNKQSTNITNNIESKPLDKNIIVQEMRAKVFSEVIDKTNGKLSVEYLELICNTIDIYNTYENRIIVLHDPNKFTEKLVNDRIRIDDNRTMNEITTKVLVGENIEIKLFSNSNKIDLNKIYIIQREARIKYWNNFYGITTGGYNEIVIYLPVDKDYKIDPRIQYIIDNFNISDKN